MEMNIPVGKRLSEEKLKNVNNLEEIDLLTNYDYLELFNNFDIKKNDFIFIDPPYLQSEETNKSVYANVWNEENEKKLLEKIEFYHKKGVKFMITNTLINKGVENKLLNDFIKRNKFKVIILNRMNNANGKINDDYKEVAIINYQTAFEQTKLF